MKKIKLFFIVIVLLSWSACASKSEPVVPLTAEQIYAARSFFNSTPDNGTLIFIGTSRDTYHLNNNKKAIQNALKDASRKVALYKEGLEGSFERGETTGSGFLDFSQNVKKEVKPETNENYIDDLEYNPDTDVFYDPTHQIVLVRCRYKGETISVKHTYQERSVGQRPNWVIETPKIDGYFVGVYRGNFHMNYGDTIIESYENAALAIIRDVYTSVEGKYYLQSDSAKSFGSFKQNSDGTISASGHLTNFYVLETWIEETGASPGVWTLAVAKLP